jgi:hypothetical protein
MAYTRKCYRENCPEYPTRIRLARERIAPKVTNG